MVIKKGIKWLIYAEIAAVGGAYIVWHRMNTNQGFRKYMYDNHPKILEGFYQAAEYGGYIEGRKMDYKAWGISVDGVTDFKTSSKK